MKWTVLIVMFAVLTGCTGKEVDHQAARHQAESLAPQVRAAPHREDHASTETAMLMIQTEPEVVQAGEPATIRLMIHDSAGAVVKDFETLHEQKIHLIIVRDGLDQFAHIHPQVDADGNISTVFTFPTGGTYRLYANHKSTKEGQSTAIGGLKVSGDTPPAAELSPNEPGRITGDGLNADVSVENAKMSGTARIVFSLTDSSDAPVVDLQPYMGAMGHLDIISADGKQYVHAHPAEVSTTDGDVEFEVHNVMPGVYKVWGQFQRGGNVRIISFVSGFSWDE
jgi:hypothetical protein